jgi:predicted dehydrogenase
VHVLCEKPLAYDVAQAQDLVRALDSRRLVGKLGFLFRFSPVIQRLKQLIDDGRIGEIQLIEILTINAQFMDPTRPLHWKMQRARANGGVFVEYGAHSIDLALWLAGPVSRLVAHGVTLIQERPSDGTQTAVVTMDDTASWITQHESGVEGLFRTGWASLPIGGGGLRVYGTKGSLAWQLDATGRQHEYLLASMVDQPTTETLLEFTASSERGQGEESFPLGLLADYNQRLVRSFVDDIRRGRGSDPSFANGFEAQKVLAAIRTSLDEHRWVELGIE